MIYFFTNIAIAIQIYLDVLFQILPRAQGAAYIFVIVPFFSLHLPTNYFLLACSHVLLLLFLTMCVRLTACIMLPRTQTHKVQCVGFSPLHVISL